MKIMITGATGLLGGNTARVLALEAGAQVRVLVRRNSDRGALAGLGAEEVEGDIRDRESVRRAVAGCDAVVHCAASVSQWRPNLPEMRRINIDGTVNVLEEALAAGVRRAVHVSSVDTLGLSSLQAPADEAADHASMAAFGNPYVDTKYESEQRALAIGARGLDLVIVKPTYMIGEWDVKPTSGQMVVEVAKGRALGCPGGGNNFVDVLDVARGVRLALEKGRPGEAYILANVDGNLTYCDFFSLVARLSGRRPPRFTIPYPVAIGAGYLMDVAGRILGREPDVNSVTARMGYAPHYFTPAKAIRELGLPQSPLEGAVRRALDWFAARKMI